MTEWFKFGAIGATVVASWGYLRAVWGQLISLLVVNVAFDAEAAWVVRHKIVTEYSPVFLGARAFFGAMWFVRSRNRTETVVIEDMASGGRFYRRGWQLLWVTQSGNHSDNPPGYANSPGSSGQTGLSLTFLRGTFDLEAWVQAATSAYNRELCSAANAGSLVSHHYGTANQFITDGPGYGGAQSRPVGDTVSREQLPLGLRAVTHDREDLGRSAMGLQTFADLAYPPEVLAVLADIREWLHRKDWYQQRHIPWRMGLLFTGSPGTGKTSAVRALAAELSLPVHVMHLATMYDHELDSSFRSTLYFTPCIVLLEDVDSVFEGRKAVAKLSFDALLNCIDGIDAMHGVLLIMTTNRPEQLDPAIAGGGVATRPGRIDRVIEFRPLTEECRYKIVRRILRDHPELHDELVRLGDGDTGAQFQGRCVCRALSLGWKKPSAGTRRYQPGYGNLEIVRP